MMRIRAWWLLSIGLACVSPVLLADERAQVQSVTPTLEWFNDLDEALVASKESRKPILLEFR